MSCVFCELTRDLPARDSVLALKPLNPVTDGHMLFIPKAHVIDAGQDTDLTGLVMKHAAEHAKRLNTAYNIITSSGEDATQSVFHLHIHVVPRRPDDGLTLPWTGQKKDGDAIPSDLGNS